KPASCRSSFSLILSVGSHTGSAGQPTTCVASASPFGIAWCAVTFGLKSPIRPICLEDMNELSRARTPGGKQKEFGAGIPALRHLLAIYRSCGFAMLSPNIVAAGEDFGARNLFRFVSRHAVAPE